MGKIKKTVLAKSVLTCSLVAVLSVTAVSDLTLGVEEGSLTVTLEEMDNVKKEERIFTKSEIREISGAEDIKKFNQFFSPTGTLNDIQTKIINARGPSLKDVIVTAGIDFDNVGMIKFKTKDGESAEYSKDYLFAERYFYASDEESEKRDPILSYKDDYDKEKADESNEYTVFYGLEAGAYEKKALTDKFVKNITGIELVEKGEVPKSLKITGEGINDKRELKMTAADKDGKQLGVKFDKSGDDRRVIWTSSDQSKIRVDAFGKLTYVSDGEVIITAKSALDQNIKDQIIVNKKEAQNNGTGGNGSGTGGSGSGSGSNAGGQGTDQGGQGGQGNQGGGTGPNGQGGEGSGIQPGDKLVPIGAVQVNDSGQSSSNNGSQQNSDKSDKSSDSKDKDNKDKDEDKDNERDSDSSSSSSGDNSSSRSRTPSRRTTSSSRRSSSSSSSSGSSSSSSRRGASIGSSGRFTSSDDDDDEGSGSRSIRRNRSTSRRAGRGATSASTGRGSSSDDDDEERSDTGESSERGVLVDRGGGEGTRWRVFEVEETQKEMPQLNLTGELDPIAMIVIGIIFALGGLQRYIRYLDSI